MWDFKWTECREGFHVGFQVECREGFQVVFLVGLYVASEREQSDPRLRGALVCLAPHTSAPHTVERGAPGMVE